MKTDRSNTTQRISEVCDGLAEPHGWSAALLRVIWALATIFTAFAGGVLHLALWELMPEALMCFESAMLQPWKTVA